MLQKEQSALVIIDVQGKLATLMHETEEMVANVATLAQAMPILEVPIIWLEQYPKGLGPTDERVSQYLTDNTPISKTEFNACLNQDFMARVKELNITQFILCGIESHICVAQTATALRELGYHVEVVVDAVSSRTEQNKSIGIDKMKAVGALPTSTEGVIYELLQKAGTAQFKQILPLIK